MNKYQSKILLNSKSLNLFERNNQNETTECFPLNILFYLETFRIILKSFKNFSKVNHFPKPLHIFTNTFLDQLCKTSQANSKKKSECFLSFSKNPVFLFPHMTKSDYSQENKANT